MNKKNCIILIHMVEILDLTRMVFIITPLPDLKKTWE